MMRLTKLYYVILIFFSFSCKENNPENNNSEKKIEWDYLNSSFKNSDNQGRLGMLCGYDTFELKRIDDSLFEMNLAEFQGWKKDSKKYNDTLKLTENKKVLDSAGNQKTQILKFSNKNNVNLEVMIDKTKAFSDSINNYEYSGKIKIENNKFKYSCNELWVK